MAKKQRLKARGIRFPDEMWNKLKADAAKIKTSPSEIVRSIISRHYEKSKK